MRVMRYSFAESSTFKLMNHRGFVKGKESGSDKRDKEIRTRRMIRSAGVSE
jgi:hypothetical protein